MISFSDFIAKQHDVRLSSLLESVETQDTYWLGTNFFNYLYFILHSRFNEKFCYGDPIRFVSDKSSSSDRTNYENSFDFPVTLYFYKHPLLDFIENISNSPKESSDVNTEETSNETSNETTEETSEETTEETTEETSEEDDIKSDFIVDVEKFVLPKDMIPKLLKKIEISFLPINELRLDKDFREFNRLLSLRSGLSDLEMRENIKNRIKDLTKHWVFKMRGTEEIKNENLIDLDFNE